MLPGAVAVMAIVEYRPAARLRGVRRLMFGRWRLSGTPGMTFFRVLGSGQGGGFWLTPSFSHQGLFCVFDDDAAADAFLAGSTFIEGVRADARFLVTMKLRAYASRGRWGGVEPCRITVDGAGSGPIVSLTRASIRPSKAARFWRRAPPAERDLTGIAGCRLAVGLGEAPLLRQCTFTLWDDEPAMIAYARSGAHLEAIRAARREAHFHEDLFARFRPYAVTGCWQGRAVHG